MKKFILGIILGGIIFGTGVYAISNYLYKADEVSYTPGDTTWNVSDVNSALNDLHDKAKNYIPKPSGNKQITISSTGTSSPVDVTNYETATCKTSGLYSSCSSCCSSCSSGYFSETTLWTNPSPNANIGQGKTTTLTLNYGLSGYSYIKIYFKATKSSTLETWVMYPMSDFINNYSDNPNSSNGKGKPGAWFGMTNTTPIGVSRTVSYASNTTIKLSTGGAYGYADNAGYPIPTKITGVNLRP